LASRTHTFQSALAILAVCAVALGSHGPKRPASPAPKPPATLSAQEIFKRVSPSVTVVKSLDGEGKVIEFGSGVVIAPGKVITNRHVIEDGASYQVEQRPTAQTTCHSLLRGNIPHTSRRESMP